LNTDFIQVFDFFPNQINKHWENYQENISNGNIFEFKINDGERILLENHFYDNLNDINLFSDVFKNKHSFGDITALKLTLRDLKDSRQKNRILINTITIENLDEYNFLRNNKIDEKGLILYFNKCEFKFSEGFIFNNYGEIEPVIWSGCNIPKIEIYAAERPEHQHLMTTSFVNCNIDTFIYLPKSPEKELTLINNDINEIVTNSKIINMKNVNIQLFKHTNLSIHCDFSFETVFINYNKSILGRVSKKEEKDYLNSYKMLFGNSGLFSQKYTIEKYINYFLSRDNWFFKMLFWFNGGYTNYLGPIISISLTLGLMSYFLFSNQDIYANNNITLVPIFYPIDMFKTVILNSFTAQFSLIKLMLIFCEIVYIYSVFCLITFVKRKFGFKKEI